MRRSAPLGLVALCALVLVCDSRADEPAAGALKPGAARTLRQMERLGRGVVAIRHNEKRVFVSWRLLRTDPDDVAFNLYRKAGAGEANRLSEAPLTKATCFEDTSADFGAANEYFVRAVGGGREEARSHAFLLAANAPVRPYLAIPLKTPEGYAPND